MTTEKSKKQKEENLRLRCPFQAHADEHDLSYDQLQAGHCSREKTYPDIQRLNEHLKRVHSRQFWCSGCYYKFNICSDKDIEVLKRNHEDSCGTVSVTQERLDFINRVVMTEIQYNSWLNWKKIVVPLRETKGKVKEKKAYHTWRKIYSCLYPGMSIPESVFREGSDDESCSTNGSHTASSHKSPSSSSSTGESEGSRSPEGGPRLTSTPHGLYQNISSQHAIIPEHNTFHPFNNFQQTQPLDKIQQNFQPGQWDIPFGTPSMTSFDGSILSADPTPDMMSMMDPACFDYEGGPFIFDTQFPGSSYDLQPPGLGSYDPYELMLDVDLQQK